MMSSPASSHSTHPRGGPTHPPTLLLVGLVTQVAIALVGLGPSLPWAVRCLGAALMLAGIALNVVAVSSFQQVGTPVSPRASSSALVTEGVFRWSRNPMYVGLAAVLTGAALALASPTALIVVVAFVAVMTPLIRVEERRLEGLFGDAYRAYRRRVRRWL